MADTRLLSQPPSRPILGGVLEHPTNKYPWAFYASGLFAQYPYLLPCLVASFIPAGGAMLCLFLSRDGGPRTGAIFLPVEKENLRRVGDHVLSHARMASRAAAHTSANRLGSFLPHSSPSAASQHGPFDSTSLAESSHAGGSHHFHRQGTAYGYRSNPSVHRANSTDGTPNPLVSRNISFAERFLLATDSMSLVDFWVAAALGGEQDAEAHEGSSRLEEQASSSGRSSRSSPWDEERGSVSSDDLSDVSYLHAGEADAHVLDPDQPFGDALASTRAQEETRETMPLPPLQFTSSFRSERSTRTSRRPQRGHLSVPALYRRSGVRSTGSDGKHHPPPNGHPASLSNATSAAAATQPAAAEPTIPYLVIGLYTLLALHSSSFEQIFSVFLATSTSEGGLGLTAGHFAALIAIMAIGQVVLQYQFYPRVGPPLGKLTHAGMLCLGMALYWPVYLLFPLLRPLENMLPQQWHMGRVVVMPAMVAFSALRYLANVSAFTSIVILINALSAPHLVSLANGLAQTTTSAARCLGPILGGILWARSIASSPGNGSSGDGSSSDPSLGSGPENYYVSFVQVGWLALLGACISWFIR